MTNEKKFEWLLRIGVAGEFLGHGMLAIQGKKDWIGWIGDMLKVSPETATTLLLLIGLMDVLVAIIVLVKPVRPILLWAALVRPIIGQPIWDFIERSANWAAPLALFYLYRSRK